MNPNKEEEEKEEEEYTGGWRRGHTASFSFLLQKKGEENLISSVL